MKTIGIYEAKNKFPYLLDCISQGESFTLTRHGKPVAILQPFNINKKESISEVIEKIRKFRDKHPLKNISIKELIQEGRKY